MCVADSLVRNGRDAPCCLDAALLLYQILGNIGGLHFPAHAPRNLTSNLHRLTVMARAAQGGTGQEQEWGGKVRKGIQFHGPRLHGMMCMTSTQL